MHGKPPLDELLQLASHFDALRESLVQHDVGRGLGQSVIILKTDDGAFTNGLVFKQTVFNLSRRNENAADLQHLVCPPAVPEIAFGVASELVARRAVIAGEG